MMLPSRPPPPQTQLYSHKHKLPHKLKLHPDKQSKPRLLLMPVPVPQLLPKIHQVNTYLTLPSMEVLPLIHLLPELELCANLDKPLRLTTPVHSPQMVKFSIHPFQEETQLASTSERWESLSAGRVLLFKWAQDKKPISDAPPPPPMEPLQSQTSQLTQTLSSTSRLSPANEELVLVPCKGHHDM